RGGRVRIVQQQGQQAHQSTWVPQRRYGARARCGRAAAGGTSDRGAGRAARRSESPRCSAASGESRGAGARVAGARVAGGGERAAGIRREGYLRCAVECAVPILRASFDLLHQCPCNLIVTELSWVDSSRALANFEAHIRLPNMPTLQHLMSPPLNPSVHNERAIPRMSMYPREQNVPARRGVLWVARELRLLDLGGETRDLTERVAVLGRHRRELRERCDRRTFYDLPSLLARGNLGLGGASITSESQWRWRKIGRCSRVEREWEERKGTPIWIFGYSGAGAATIDEKGSDTSTDCPRHTRSEASAAPEALLEDRQQCQGNGGVLESLDESSPGLARERGSSTNKSRARDSTKMHRTCIADSWAVDGAGGEFRCKSSIPSPRSSAP
ncbi:hypothetical protein C8R45DRAFT_948076, partial [Mycena sanguinolenta]